MRLILGSKASSMPYQFGDVTRSLFGYQNASGFDLKDELSAENILKTTLGLGNSAVSTVSGVDTTVSCVFDVL